MLARTDESTGPSRATKEAIMAALKASPDGRLKGPVLKACFPSSSKDEIQEILEQLDREGKIKLMDFDS
jgi:hypothetical protein